MSLPLGPVIALYDALTTPIPQLVALGLPVTTLDVIGTLRLALVVQQIKFALRVKAAQGAPNHGEEKEKRAPPTLPDDTALSSIWALLVIV
ncbi:hypothetical protein FRB90_002493, partial [Tulasnella sp. 427]